MAKNIDPKLKKIGEYLKLEGTAIFAIPEYQRAYSWEIKHCDKLWQDIEDYIDSGGIDPYFFGTIIVNCQEEDTKLSLIDGQQRTTTFILLLKALLIRLNTAIKETENDKDSKRLNSVLTMKRNNVLKILYKANDEEIFDILEDFTKVSDKQIIINSSINELYKSELNVILSSPDFESAEQKVHRIPYKQKDNKYTNYFRNFKFFYNKLVGLSSSYINLFAENVLEKCEIIEIRSWNVEQAITMFNSLNSDGMPLLDADIISAKLYSKSESNREEFNLKWEELVEKVTQLEQLKIVDIDAVLMQYMYIQRSRDKDYISEKGSISVTTPGLRRYYTEIKKVLLENPLELTRELLKITETWLKIKDYPIVKLLLRFNENIKLYLMSYLSRYEVEEIEERHIGDISEPLLKLFTILELVDTGYSSSKFKTFLFGINVKLVDKNVDIIAIKKEFNRHIYKEWDKENIEKEVVDYNKNILVFMNEYLYTREANIEFILPVKHEIEHIMPNSGRNLSQIRSDAGIEDRDEFLDIVNKLGNKILLEEDINRSVGNAWFRTKIQNSVSKKSGYKDSKFAIATSLVKTYSDKENQFWTKNDINRTTEKIAKRFSSFIFDEN